MINLKHKLIFIMTIGLFGCASPQQEDFVGVWVGDSLALELKSDGSCIAKGNNAYLLLRDDAKPSDLNQTIQGHWEFNYRLYQRNSIFESKRIEVSFTDNNTKKSFCSPINYTKYLIDNFYTLYFYIGDPDDMNRFKFKKQND